MANFDIERMKKALASKMHKLPKVMTVDQMRKYIIENR